MVLLAEDKTKVHVLSKAERKERPRYRPELMNLASVARPRDVLIAGWRPGMATILRELSDSVGRRSRVTIVCELGLKERSKFLEREGFDESSLRRRGITIRHVIGDPCDQDSLGASTSCDGAIVLLDHASPATTVKQRESRVLETLTAMNIALKKAKKPPHVVAETYDRGYESLAKGEYPDVTILSLDEFSGLLLAQAAYEPAVLPVLRELLSSGGAEITLQEPWYLFLDPHEALDIATLQSRCRTLHETFLGYVDGHGQVRLNPQETLTVTAHDLRHVVVISSRPYPDAILQRSDQFWLVSD